MSPSTKHTRRHGMLNIASPSSIISLFPPPPSSVSPPSPPPSLSGSCHSASTSSPSVLHTPPSSDDDHIDFDDTCWFDSDPEDATAWYARELGQIVSLQTPLPPTFPSRPDSVFPNYKRRQSLSRRPSAAINPLAFPSTQLDPAYPSRIRSIIYSKPLPPPPPLPRLSFPVPPPISPCLRINANERPLPRTPLPADVCSFADEEDNNTNEHGHEYEHNVCDPFQGNYFPHDSDSDSVYSQDLDSTDFSCDISFAVTTATTKTTAATTTAEDVNTRQSTINDASPFTHPPLRSRWSSSTLGSSPVTSSSPSSRLRAYLVGARKGTSSRTTSSFSSPTSTPSSSPQRRNVRAPSSVANMVGWAPALLGVRRSGSRASASSSSESGRSSDSVLTTDCGGNPGIRRKPIPIEMFLRAT